MCHPTPNQENEVMSMSSIIRGSKICKKSLSLDMWIKRYNHSSTECQNVKIVDLGYVGDTNRDPTTWLGAPTLLPTSHNFKNEIAPLDGANVLYLVNMGSSRQNWLEGEHWNSPGKKESYQMGGHDEKI